LTCDTSVNVVSTILTEKIKLQHIFKMRSKLRLKKIQLP